MSPTNELFRGLKVIELASVLAGPAVGQFFAELGAEVIKVENATTQGDVTRSWKVKGEDKDKSDSAYYRSINWGKRSVLLNLKEESGRLAVYELLVEADVVISNFPVAVAEKLGMTAPRLREKNPRLIYAQLDAFPEGDDRPAYDIVLQAEAGFLGMTGTSGGELCRMPVALIDLLAAHQMKEGILLALLQREKTGKGSVVKTNLYASAIASLANQATNYLIANHIPRPMGSEHPNIAPYGDVFSLADGTHIVLAVGSDRQFSALCKVLDLPNLPDFATNNERVSRRQQLVNVLAEQLKHCCWPEIQHLCSLEKIPVGRIKNMEEVFEDEATQSLLLHYPDGQRSVKTVAFSVE